MSLTSSQIIQHLLCIHTIATASFASLGRFQALNWPEGKICTHTLNQSDFYCHDSLNILERIIELGFVLAEEDAVRSNRITMVDTAHT